MSTKKKLHHMQHNEKLIIMNVIKFFDKEKSINGPSVPFSYSVKRAAAATGVSESSIKRLRRLLESGANESGIPLNPKRRIRAKKILIEDTNICEIRRKIAEFYIDRKELPSLKKLLAILKQEIKYEGGREHLRKLLLDVGFRFKKCADRRQIMLERSDIVAARSRYLRKLRGNDSLQDLRKPVIYIDETYIGSSLTVSKEHQLKETNVPEAFRWVIVHVGRTDSFTPGNLLIYNSRTKVGEAHDSSDVVSLKNWMLDRILQTLKEPSVIITGNLPYHPNVQQNLPMPSAKKQALQDWLRANEIGFEPDMRNAELYELVQQHRPKTRRVIDELLISRGHEVLRLPPFHCDLNPVEYLWRVLKRNVVIDRNVFKSGDDVGRAVEDALRKVSAEDWYREIWNVNSLEWQYWNRDMQMEEEISRLGVTEDSDAGLSSDGESDCVANIV